MVNDRTGAGPAGEEGDVVQPSQGAVSAGLGRDLVALIRSLILTGDIAPGEKILPRRLQERYGVSHIPVREALRTLEAEGLVVTVPRRGSTAAAVSLGELREVYALRRSVEPPLIAEATRARTDEQVGTAREALARLERSDPGDLDPYLAAHRDFHWQLIAPAVAPLTRRVLDQLWLVSERYVRLGIAAYRVDEPARHDHRRLLDAYAEGDAGAVATETADHLTLVEATIRAQLEDRLA
jgi:DNA-binding GntR family transcriptional regulator